MKINKFVARDCACHSLCQWLQAGLCTFKQCSVHEQELNGHYMVLEVPYNRRELPAVGIRPYYKLLLCLNIFFLTHRSLLQGTFRTSWEFGAPCCLLFDTICNVACFKMHRKPLCTLFLEYTIDSVKIFQNNK